MFEGGMSDRFKFRMVGFMKGTEQEREYDNLIGEADIRLADILAKNLIRSSKIHQIEHVEWLSLSHPSDGVPGHRKSNSKGMVEVHFLLRSKDIMSC